MTKELKHKTIADLIISSSYRASCNVRSPIHTASTTLMQISALKSAVLSWEYGELTDFQCTDDDACIMFWNE